MIKKTKTTLTIDPELYEKAKEKAAQDARSFNSLVVKLLQDYVRDTEGSK